MTEIFLPEPTKIDFSRDIIHCHTYLQDRWPKLVAVFHEATGHDLSLTCTWRSVREQQRLFAQGRAVSGPIVTQIDGVAKKSNHNLYPARAFDVAVNIVQPDSKMVITWQEGYYHPLVDLCKKLGLVSGGSWERFKDWPHVEMPHDVARLAYHRLDLDVTDIQQKEKQKCSTRSKDT